MSSSAPTSSSIVKSEENDDEWEKYEKNSREDDWKDGDNEYYLQIIFRIVLELYI